MLCSNCSVRMAASMDFCPNRGLAEADNNVNCPIEFVLKESALELDDVKVIVNASGKLLMNTSIADNAIAAAQSAVRTPLIDDTFVNGAIGILLIIVGDENMTMRDAAHATEIVNNAVGQEAAPNIIFTTSIDNGLKNKTKVTVLAAGIKDDIWKKLMAARSLDDVLAEGIRAVEESIDILDNMRAEREATENAIGQEANSSIISNATSIDNGLKNKT